MRNTTNYNLKLPDGPDKYNIQDFNSNTEKIDAELKIHSDAIADRYNKTEIDNKFSMHEMNVDWKESVDTFDDIATTCPNPESGWTVNVKDTSYTYRYDGTQWIAISANAIPKATEKLDGLMGKEKVVEINSINKEVVDARKAIQGKRYTTLKDRINDIYQGNEIMGKGANGITNYEGDTFRGGGITSFEFDIHMFGNVEQMRIEGDICGVDVEDIVQEGKEKGITPILLTQTEMGFHVSVNIDASVITVANKIKCPGEYFLTFLFNGTFASYATSAIRQLSNEVAKLNSNLINRFECGNVDITGKSGEWIFVTVNYSYPHENIPFVVASHGSAEVAQCACTTRYRTTTGFQIGVYNTTAHTTFNWIAIEP